MRKLQNSELPRLTPEEFQVRTKTPVIIILDNVRSHLNVGSVFRTADAFLIEAIYLCGITGTPPHRDIHKSALGATETVAWQYFETTAEAVAALKERGYKIAAIEQAENATMLNDLNYNGTDKLALIFGNEVDGVDQSIVSASDIVIEIPQFGTKHSLNISVSVGVVLWEIVRQISL
ncbi:MAG: tRNA ((18)-2-O)-methyltransferase [Bacteroidetes bacterium]|nr:tRNA ((18)-2-O)-methyltransferase [Bacteroidota bacterium]